MAVGSSAGWLVHEASSKSKHTKSLPTSRWVAQYSKYASSQKKRNDGTESLTLFIVGIDVDDVVEGVLDELEVHAPRVPRLRDALVEHLDLHQR